MAEAEAYPVVDTEVTLRLTEEEAETLVALANHVGGHATRSPRFHMDNISDVISDVLELDPLDLIDDHAAEGEVFFHKFKEDQE